QINQYLASSMQQTNTHLQMLSMGTTTSTGDQNAIPSRRLTVQLLVFSDKDGENVLTWLLQVNLLFKARKVQADESHQLFASWESFAARIKDTFQLPHHQQML
ncbi:24488_t:CDS:2, partial [Cetraspora pellucida]